MASIATEMVQQQSPPQASMSSLEALIQAAQFLEDSESECPYLFISSVFRAHFIMYPRDFSYWDGCSVASCDSWNVECITDW